MTLQNYLDLWLDTYVKPRRAPKTVEAYKNALAHLSSMNFDAQIDQLTPITLQRDINQLSAIYPRQAQILFIALRAALARAERLGMIGSSPMRLCDPPAHEPQEISILTPAEAAAYAQAARQQRAGSLLILMLCLGLRRNEARALRGGDLVAGVLQIRHQRTKSGLAPLKSKSSKRDLPVPEPLRAFFNVGQGEYLADVSETALRRQHLAVLAAIGVNRRITLHGLRHTCATMAADGGTPLSTIQRLLGHRHFTTTADYYLHADRRMLARCTELLYNQFDLSSMGDGARLEIV